jgi:hypothetical protein
MRSASVLLGFLLLACASPQPPQPVAIVGQYRSRLSATDIEEIRAVASKYSRQPLYKLNVVRPTKVRVQTGSKANWTRFTVVKRAGNWLRDENAPLTAEVERTITTY